MLKQHWKYAHFHNFKEGITCPFCIWIRDLTDIGGSQLVQQRLGVLESDTYKHDFLTCFISHYWINDLHLNGSRSMDEVIKDGYEIYNQMNKILSIA